MEMWVARLTMWSIWRRVATRYLKVTDTRKILFNFTHAKFSWEIRSNRVVTQLLCGFTFNILPVSCTGTPGSRNLHGRRTQSSSSFCERAFYAGVPLSASSARTRRLPGKLRTRRSPTAWRTTDLKVPPECPGRRPSRHALCCPLGCQGRQGRNHPHKRRGRRQTGSLEHTKQRLWHKVRHDLHIPADCPLHTRDFSDLFWFIISFF